MVYLIAFVITLIFSYLYTKEFPVLHSTVRESNMNGVVYHRNRSWLNQPLKKILLFFITVLPIWFITAFRYDVGTDYLYTYVKFFHYTEIGGSPYNEPFFQLINTILVKLGLSYVCLFAICGAIINLAVFDLIFKYSTNPILSIVLYFCSAIFFNSLNNVRQYIAIAIAALSFFQEKNWKSVLIILIAGMFHFSAFLFLGFWIFSKFRFNRKTYAAFSLLTIILTPVLVQVMLALLAKTHYGYFIGYSDGFSFLTVLINVVVYIFTLIYYDKSDSQYRTLANIQLIAIVFCFASVLLQNEELWMRFIRMASFFHILLIPKIVVKAKYKEMRWFMALLFIMLYLFYTFYVVYVHGGLEVFPYQFVFNKVG